MIAAIKGEHNVSDKLSRLFDLPKVLLDTVQLKDIKIPSNIPELEDKAFSIEEARKFVSKLGNLHTVEKKQAKNKQAKEKDTVPVSTPNGIISEKKTILSIPR